MPMPVVVEPVVRPRAAVPQKRTAISGSAHQRLRRIRRRREPTRAARCYRRCGCRPARRPRCRDLEADARMNRPLSATCRPDGRETSPTNTSVPDAGTITALAALGCCATPTEVAATVAHWRARTGNTPPIKELLGHAHLGVTAGDYAHARVAPPEGLSGGATAYSFRNTSTARATDAGVDSSCGSSIPSIGRSSATLTESPNSSLTALREWSTAW